MTHAPLAGYTCWSCDFKWSQSLGPSCGWEPVEEWPWGVRMIHIDAPPAGCPKCGHPYMTCDRFATSSLSRRSSGGRAPVLYSGGREFDSTPPAPTLKEVL